METVQTLEFSNVYDLFTHIDQLIDTQVTSKVLDNKDKQVSMDLTYSRSPCWLCLICIWEIRTMTSVFYRAPKASYPIAASATGTRIIDRDGNEWLDMSGGAAVSAVGHGHPTVLAAIQDQLAKIPFAHTAFFSNAPQEELAERISARFSELDSKVYFSSGGSEANETAAKMAWQYWQAKGQPNKKIIISREYSYHGNTLGALSLSGNPARRRQSAAPLLDWPRVSPCYAYRFQGPQESEAQYTARLIKELSATIANTGPDTIAAFICEPVVGASLGVVPPTAQYLAAVRQLCDDNDILLICDEVMCGSGRTGTWFAHAQDAIVPDLVTVGKGIAGGYVPLAATIIRKHLSDVLSESGFVHGHTYVGHALACAAGCGVMNVLETDNLLAQTSERGAQLMARLREDLGDHPALGDVRGRGFFIGLEFVSDKETKAGFAGTGKSGEAIKAAAMAQGLICYPGHVTFDGLTVPHILLAPPLIASDSDFDLLIDKLKRVMDHVFAT